MDILFLSIFAIVILFYSYKEGLGHLREPAAGSFGFFIGIILLVTSILIGIKNLGHPHKKPQVKGFLPFFKVIGAMIAYALLLERSGLLLTTFITSLILFSRRDYFKTFRWPLITVAATLGVYFVFVVVLKCQFPKGIIERILSIL